MTDFLGYWVLPIVGYLAVGVAVASVATRTQPAHFPPDDTTELGRIVAFWPIFLTYAILAGLAHALGWLVRLATRR